jgi:precorrin-3B methylase
LGKVWFIGAGPGAPDLLTVRGARLIGEADVVIWARSLVNEGVLEHARPGVEIVESTTIPLEGVREVYGRAVAENLKVQHYASAPSGNPSPGLFAHKKTCDTSESSCWIDVPAAKFYGVHVNVGTWVPDPNFGP